MLAELTFAHGQTHHSARNLAVFRRRRASLELHARGGGAVCYTRRREPTNEGARRARRRNSLQERRPSDATDEARSAALNDIGRAIEFVRGGDDRTLTVSVLPAFATRWLIPRLSRFNALHPDVDINIRASQSLIDFDRDGVDLAVRFGAGNWPGLHSEKLLEEELFPVHAPSLKAAARLSETRQLLDLPLLHDERQPWSIWFNSIGIDPPRSLSGPIYSDANLLMEAALAGHGIALARTSFVAPDLDSGRLVRPFNQSAKTKFSHYVVYPIRSEGQEKIARFKEWILGEASKETQPPSGTNAQVKKRIGRNRRSK
jgi:LysR family glycine cleavage system transcriptional activator